MRAGIALGSNVGDRLAHLFAAYQKLSAISTPNEPILCASIYESEPMDCPPDSPLFLNTVIEIDFDKSVSFLLENTQRIERELGRKQKTIRNAPREIDCDILYLGQESILTDSLTLPHPRIFERRFVLEPLAEICPDLVLPHASISMKAAFDQLGDDSPRVRAVASGFSALQSPAS